MRWWTTAILYSVSAVIGFTAGAGVVPEVMLHVNPYEPTQPSRRTVLARLGVKVVLPEKDVLGQDLPKDGLVVFLGQCSSCSLRAIPPGSVRPLEGRRVVILYDGVATDASKALAKALPPTHQLVYVVGLKSMPALENVGAPAAVVVRGDRAVRVHTPSSPLFEVAR